MKDDIRRELINKIDDLLKNTPTSAEEQLHEFFVNTAFKYVGDQLIFYPNNLNEHYVIASEDLKIKHDEWRKDI